MILSWYWRSIQDKNPMISYVTLSNEGNSTAPTTPQILPVFLCNNSYYLAEIKGRIGAFFVRALVYNVVSCTKDGHRQLLNTKSLPYDLRIQAAYPSKS